jgi:hypothetical protein
VIAVHRHIVIVIRPLGLFSRITDALGLCTLMYKITDLLQRSLDKVSCAEHFRNLVVGRKAFRHRRAARLFCGEPVICFCEVEDSPG